MISRLISLVVGLFLLGVFYYSLVRFLFNVGNYFKQKSHNNH